MTASSPRSRAHCLGVAGAVSAAVAGVSVLARNVRQVARMRQAGQHAVDLDHEALVGDGSGDAIRLLVLGDSAARGHGLTEAADAFPAQLGYELARRTGRPVQVASLATDGHRTADVVALQLPGAAAGAPDVVVASVGVNDAVRMTSGRRVRAATARLATGLSQLPAEQVALVACPDLGGAPGFPVPLRWVAGWRCRRVARAQARGVRDAGAEVTLVRIGAVRAEHYGDDGFHPGAVGHAAMAALVADGLLTAPADGPATLD